jgi:amino acid transporter
VTGGVTLARYTMGTAALFGAAVVASSPLTVLVGGVTTMFGVLGVVGVPLAFVLVMLVLRLLMVGYVAVGRHVKHGAPFYAQLARGVNPTAGLVGAGLAFVGYNALQISLYGLIGTKVQGLVGGVWWVWAFVAWLLVLGLGQYPGRLVARVLGVLLALEVGVIGLFIAAGFTHPASGSVSPVVFAPSRLLVPAAVAGVVVFAVASFAGVESVLAFAEEATSERAVARAAGGAVLFCGVLYGLAAWSYGTWIGLDHLGRAVEDASQPLTLLGGMFGPGITDLATMLLVTSVLAAMVSFHSTVARYVFALARERVLPARWAAVSRGVNGGAPLGGSAVQAVVALLVVVGFLLSGADPMTMFIWLSTVGAVCVLLLLTAASWSALPFFDKGMGGNEPGWLRQTVPFIGGILGVLVVVFMMSSLGTLLGTPPGSARPWLIAVPIAVVVAAAAGTGGWLRRTRRDVYDGISYGVPDPALVRDDRLTVIEL